jgi:hypothetical protein
MIAAPRWAAAVAVLVAIAACDSPTSSSRPSSPPVVVTSADSLVPGSAASIRGSNMRQLRTLAVDGRSTTFRIISDSVASFDVPELQPCDVDGRRVDITINNGFATTATLRPTGVLRLDTGESRALDVAQLACVMLPDAQEDYVLSVASFATTPLVEPVLELRGRTAVAGTTSHATLASAFRAGDAAMHVHARPLDALARPVLAPASSSAFSFDEYATAGVGAVLRFVDWSNPASLTARTPDDLPTYQATVLAVTPTQLIVVDNRAPDLALLNTAAARQRMQAAADIAERVMLPALREVIRRDLVFPAGAGGRVVTTLVPMNGASGSIRVEELQPRVGASNFYHAVLSTELVGFTPETIARIMIHEAAHLADFEPWLRDASLGRSSIGWYSEALAVTAEDAAARLAAGNGVKARASESRWPAGVPRSGIAHSASPSAPLESTFGPPGSSPGAAGPGAYDRGARIVRYAQERLGGSGATLHQRLLADAPPRTAPLAQQVDAWSVGSIAAVLGISTRELLRNSMLADLTNDLVPADAVQRWGLPQIAAWDHTLPVDRDYRVTAGGRLLPRSAPFSLNVSVPAGGYAYWYLPAGSSAAGLSLQAIASLLREHHEVRITRLR